MVTNYSSHTVDQALKRRCSQTDQCVGFNTDAEFKTLILPENEWVKMEGNGAGSYVASELPCSPLLAVVMVTGRYRYVCS